MIAIKVPDAVRLANVQKFCDLLDPYLLPPESLFVAAMREIIDWHRERSPMYGNLLRQSEFRMDDLRTLSDLSKIPFVPANSFKEHELRSIGDAEVRAHLTSSGTTGQKSQMFFDKWTLGSAQQMLDRIIHFYGWDIGDAPVKYLLYTYEPRADLKVGTSFTDHYLCKYAPAHEICYALKNDGSGGHEFDLFGCLKFLENADREKIPVRIFGFPAFLFFTLRRMRATLTLHPDSLVFLGGGWKGHADQAIDKKTFYANLVSKLGLRIDRIKDGFGSVEHCIPYVECANHRLHVPTWSQVLIRDVRNLEVIKDGAEGFLQFISPYITSAPAHSVLMGDLAIRGSGCDCGLPTAWFEIRGRAGTSKNRSCAVAATELLKGRA